jgi:glucose/arabinose dehydrogenase
MAIHPIPVGLWTAAAGALALAAAAQSPPRDPRAGRGPYDPTLKTWAVYDQYCVACHGHNLEGNAAGSLIDGVWKFGGEDAQIAETIRDGRKGTAMAAFKPVLTEEQIWHLVLLIRQEEAAARDHPPTIVDPDGARIRSEKQSFKIEVVARDLETPWGLAFLPDGRMLVTERPGRLRIVEKGRLLPEPVAGTPKTWNEQDGGLLDVEVHPGYAENGWIYLSYAAPGPADTSMTAIVRGRLRDNHWVDEQAIYMPAADLFGTPNYHYGSRFLFDRAGKLLFSIGDRGLRDAAQVLASPLGKVHRVNDDGTVPADNPFVKTTGAVATIWTYGHRNPQGLAIDPVSGLLWESEHGPIGGDELNILEPGHNYGWPVVSHGLEPGITGTAHEGMEPPIVYWNPTIAPSGIHFYEGTRYPGWRHDLFVTGLGGTALRRLEVKGRRVTHQEVLFNCYGRVRDVVTGPDGLLYVALQLPGAKLSSSTPGVVVRLVPVETP